MNIHECLILHKIKLIHLQVFNPIHINNRLTASIYTSLDKGNFHHFGVQVLRRKCQNDHHVFTQLSTKKDFVVR